ncbi:MAG: hypothetical protein WCW68_14150 [Methanothrix sp.]
MNDTAIYIWIGNYSIQAPHISTVLLGQPWDAFLPPLTGSFLGVGLAFLVNYLANKLHQRTLKKYYLNLLKEEINQSENRLNDAIDRFQKIDFNTFAQTTEGIYPDTLPIDCWNSILSSGDLRLFDKQREAGMLSKVYLGIQNYNCGLKRTIDAENELLLYAFPRDAQMSSLFGAANKKFINEKNSLIARGNALLDDIAQLKIRLNNKTLTSEST